MLGWLNAVPESSFSIYQYFHIILPRLCQSFIWKNRNLLCLLKERNSHYFFKIWWNSKPGWINISYFIQISVLCAFGMSCMDTEFGNIYFSLALITLISFENLTKRSVILKKFSGILKSKFKQYRVLRYACFVLFLFFLTYWTVCAYLRKK